jgi:tetratricopeptide (TPR) repeat protein
MLLRCIANKGLAFLNPSPLCGSCQKASWKQHKLVCISPPDRSKRITHAVEYGMPAAENNFDSATVIKLGSMVEADLLVVTFANDSVQNEVFRRVFEKMGRAYSRQGDLPTSVIYHDKAISVWERIGDPLRLGRCIYGKCYLQMKMAQHAEAKVGFERLRALADADGLFELQGKAFIGLSQLARSDGRTSEAMEFARQALTSAGLQLPGDYGKDTDEANAIFQIIECCKVESPDLDEGLLHRLQELGVAIDADERQGGSLVSLRVANLWGLRYTALEKVPEAIAAYKELIRLAENPKFAQMAQVQKFSASAEWQIMRLTGFQ